jgi:hypothetical protein
MADFEHDASFEAAEAAGHIDLDRYEDVYQQIFSEALEDGVITEDERERLNSAASKLGLDRERLDALEHALRAAYESHHGVSVLDTTRMFAPRVTMTASAPDFVASVGPPPAVKIEEAPDEVQSLRARVGFLEGRLRELEAQLDDARNQISYEVDFSDIDAPVPSAALDEPAGLHRRLRHDPRDVTTLKSIYYAHPGDPDRQWCAAHALHYLGAADEAQRAHHAAHKTDALIQPRAALDSDSWRRLLQHPDDEPLTSDILAVIVSAVLLAHSAALKGAGKLPALNPERRLDPATSTVQAARCFSWAAATLGMGAPPLFAGPEVDVVSRLVPTVPPVCALGKRALSGRSAPELAFLAGQALAYYRPERFIRLLVPDIVDLQDLFLAALSIGNPKLPLNAAVKARVAPIAQAVQPLLESRDVDGLRAAYKRFVEHGGMANLQRWAVAADQTAVRAGFTLCPDLGVAERMLALQDSASTEAMDDLILFVTGDRYAAIRKQMGVAVGS